MTETPTPTTDDVEDQDDTVQGVARRAEQELAEAERIQQEQNAAAGLTPATEAPPADTVPASTDEPKASTSRRTTSA